MRSVKQTFLALTLGCVAMLAAPFASAGRYYNDRHDGSGAAVGLAVAIGIAALIASDHHDRHRYDRGYRYGYRDYGYRDYGYRDHGYRQRGWRDNGWRDSRGRRDYHRHGRGW